jgi:O-Antigen ligase/Tetratricopeptide repeat
MRYAFFIFTAALLFVYSEAVVEPYLVPRSVFWGLALLGGSVWFFIKKPEIPVFPSASKSLMAALLTLALWSWASFFWAHEGSLVFPAAIQYSLVAVFFVQILALRQQKLLSSDDIHTAVLVLAIIAAAVLGYNVVLGLWLGKDFTVIADHIGFLFGNKNLAASFLFLVLPFCLNFLLKNENTAENQVNSDKNTVNTVFYKQKNIFLYKKVVIGLLIAIILSIVWFSQCRSVILGLLFAILAAISILFIQKTAQKRIFIIGISIFMLIFVGTTWLNWSNLQWFTNTNTINTRLELWRNSLLMVRDYPILGVGAGNWQLFFPKYGLSAIGGATETGRLVFQRPHNDFLWIWSELGVIGIASYLFVFVILLKTGFSAAKHSLKAMIFTAFLLGYMVVAFADFPLERIEHQIVFCLLAVEILAFAEKSTQSHETENSFFIKILSFFGILTCLFSLIVLFFRYNGEIATRRIFAAHANSDWQNLAVFVQQAENPCYRFDPMTTPLDWYGGLAQAGQGNFEGAKPLFERALLRHPYHINTLNNLGSVHQVLGDVPRAITYYEKALTLSPRFDETLLNLSATYLLNKNREKAVFYFEKCRVDTDEGSRYVMLRDSLGRR